MIRWLFFHNKFSRCSMWFYYELIRIKPKNLCFWNSAYGKPGVFPQCGHPHWFHWLWPNFWHISQTTFTRLTSHKTSPTQGDSGGPLVCPNSSGAFDLVGIVSFGPGFCRDQPGVFTEVAAFSDWIRFKGRKAYSQSPSLWQSRVWGGLQMLHAFFIRVIEFRRTDWRTGISSSGIFKTDGKLWPERINSIFPVFVRK